MKPSLGLTRSSWVAQTAFTWDINLSSGLWEMILSKTRRVLKLRFCSVSWRAGTETPLLKLRGSEPGLSILLEDGSSITFSSPLCSYHDQQAMVSRPASSGIATHRPGHTVSQQGAQGQRCRLISSSTLSRDSHRPSQTLCPEQDTAIATQVSTIMSRSSEKMLYY